jgi:hypothetical protein
MKKPNVQNFPPSALKCFSCRIFIWLIIAAFVWAMFYFVDTKIAIFVVSSVSITCGIYFWLIRAATKFINTYDDEASKRGTIWQKVKRFLNLIGAFILITGTILVIIILSTGSRKKIGFFDA